MPYKVQLARPVPKQLNAVPEKDYRRIYKDLKNLAKTPRPHGCIKIENTLHRIRSGTYRIIYSIMDAEQIVLIVKIARRSEKTCRNLA